MKTILHFFILLILITTSFGQVIPGAAPPVPAGFPAQIPASFEEAWDAAITRSTTYRRHIGSNPGGEGELTVIGGGAQNLVAILTTPGTMDTIDNATTLDNAYFRLADERTTVYVSRTITDGDGFSTFESYSSFQLEKIEGPVVIGQPVLSQPTYRIPEWARAVGYNLSYYTPIPLPDNVNNAEVITYDPERPWHVETHEMPIIRHGAKTFVMMENWIYGDPELLKNSVLVIHTDTDPVRYDFGDGGQISKRRTSPVGIAPTRVEWNGGKKIRIPYTTGELAPVEETIFRYGEEGQFLENVVYDIAMTNAPANSFKILRFRVLGQWGNGGVAPTALRIVTRNSAGVVVENATEPLSINSDLWFRVILRSSASSCRVWAIWPDGITTTNGQQYGRPTMTEKGN